MYRHTLQWHNFPAVMPNSQWMQVQCRLGKAKPIISEVTNCTMGIKIQCTSCTQLSSYLKTGDKDKILHMDKGV